MRVVNGSQVPPEAGPVYGVAVPLAAAEGRSGTFVIDLGGRSLAEAIPLSLRDLPNRRKTVQLRSLRAVLKLPGGAECYCSRHGTIVQCTQVVLTLVSL